MFGAMAYAGFLAAVDGLAEGVKRRVANERASSRIVRAMFVGAMLRVVSRDLRCALGLRVKLVETGRDECAA